MKYFLKLILEFERDQILLLFFMRMFGCILGDFILYLVFIKYIFFGRILFGVNFVCIRVVYRIGLLDDDLYIF